MNTLKIPKTKRQQGKHLSKKLMTIFQMHTVAIGATNTILICMQYRWWKKKIETDKEKNNQINKKKARIFYKLGAY